MNETTKRQRPVKVTYTVTKRISSCFHVCPYFALEWNVMVCTHPEVENDGFIIEHPKCRDGFPDKCPLLKEDKTNEV